MNDNFFKNVGRHRYVSLVASVVQYFTHPKLCCVSVLIFTIISDRFMEVFTVIVDGGISHTQFMSSSTDSCTHYSQHLSNLIEKKNSS